MTNNLNKAVELLKQEGYTCVVCKEDRVYHSFERGIRPLVDWQESGLNLAGASAADKVVGKGAAMMYVLLRVKEVFSFVMKPSVWNGAVTRWWRVSSTEQAPAFALWNWQLLI